MGGSIRLTLFAVSLSLLLSCAAVQSSGNSVIGEDEVTVTVDNRNFADATIYATDGERRVRVGRVSGKTTREFTFKWFQPEIAMIVDFTGSTRTLVSPRQIVVLGELDDFLLVIGVSPNGPITFSGR